MAEMDGHRRAMQALAEMEQDAIARTRAAGEQSRAEASARTGRAARDQPDVLSIPINGPYRPPDAGELAAMAAGAAMLAGLQALESRRWPLSIPIVGGG